MDYCTGNIRQQFKGKIESNRIEYKKLLKEIDKLDTQIKSELFPSNNKPLGDQKYNMLNDKLIGNTNKLIDEYYVNFVIKNDDALVDPDHVGRHAHAALPV